MNGVSKMSSNLKDEEKKFTWVNAHKGIVDYLKNMQNRQSELIDLLKEIGVTRFSDQDQSGDIELDEIDPLTFFSYLNKYGPNKRLEIVQKLLSKIGLDVEITDGLGIPSAQAQLVWFFPYKKDRTNDEINRLWQFFFSAVNKNITDEQYNDILTIRSVGKAKISEALFCIDPLSYLPINGPMKPYLQEVFQVKTTYDSFSEYKSILESIKIKTDKPFYELSYDGWKWSADNATAVKNIPSKKNDENKNYWLYAPGSNASKWDEFYNLGIMAIGWKDLGDLNNYKSKAEITEKLQELSDKESSKKNDSTANYEFKSRIKIGDIVIVKKGRSELLGYGLITSDYFYDEKREDFKKCRKVDWKKKGSWKVDGSLSLKTLTDITPYNSDNPDYTYYYEGLMRLMEGDIEYQLDFPLNTILYGPPGTGKTYTTIKKAASIIENRIIDDFDEAKEIFNLNLGSRIRFLTFHQNYSYEDFIQGLRPNVEQNANLSFTREDGIFTRISVEALFEYYKIYKKQKKKVDIDKTTDINEIYLDFIESIKKVDNPEYDTITGAKVFVYKINDNNNFEFRHSESTRTYIVSSTRLLKLFEFYPDINMIKNLNNDIRGALGGCNATVYWVALKEFIKFYNNYKSVSKVLPEDGVDDLDDVTYERKKSLLSTVELSELRTVSTESVNSYVIIIDEINRANISRVFGELITLIEKDKRSHGQVPLSSTLPSREDFIVPSNLYIIGTMNTADKSIALLDIALRRRFFFEPMYPLYEIEGTEIFDVDILQNINKQIIEKKGYDFQIGHSYFMNSDISIKERMNNSVIPLLLEYFMNDEAEVRRILKNAGLEVCQNKWPLSIDGLI